MNQVVLVFHPFPPFSSGLFPSFHSSSDVETFALVTFRSESLETQYLLPQLLQSKLFTPKETLQKSVPFLACTSKLTLPLLFLSIYLFIFLATVLPFSLSTS